MTRVWRNIAEFLLDVVVYSAATFLVLALIGLLPAEAHHNGRCHYVTVNGGAQVYVCP